MYKQLVGFCAALMMAAVFSLPARGDLLVYEGFDYPHGTRLYGLEGGFGWGAAWASSNDGVVAANAAALSYTDAFGVSLPVEGLGLSIGRTYRSGERYLENPIEEPGVYWISFLIKPSYTLVEGQTSTIFVELRSGTTVRMQIGKVSANPYYGLRVGSTAAYSEVDGEEKIEDVFPTQFLVVRYEIGTSTDDGQIHLFINPNLGPANRPALEEADAVLPNFDSTRMAFNQVKVTVISGGSPTSVGRGYVDELRIGQSYADVTVPGPAATMLLIK